MSESPNDNDGTSLFSGFPQTTNVPTFMDPDSSDDEETESLTASISDYVHENGRTYHRYKEGSYPYPNDAAEMERLDFQYETIKRLLGGKLYSSPLKNPRTILDIGTGTGQWAIDIADEFPDAEVTGTDLSPTQHLDVPENVHFEIDDCSEDEWGRELKSFDLIHTAMLLGALESFRKLVRTAYEHLRPGDGWLECLELDPKLRSEDDSIPEDSKAKEWIELIDETSTDRLYPPRPLRFADRISRWMVAEGYVDVQEQIYKLPINPWPRDPHVKELAKMWEAATLDGMSGFTYKHFGRDGLAWTRDEIELYLVDVRNSFKDRTVHAYQTIHVVYGRRPSEEKELEIREKQRQRKAEKVERKRVANEQKASTDQKSSTQPGPP